MRFFRVEADVVMACFQGSCKPAPLGKVDVMHKNVVMTIGAPNGMLLPHYPRQRESHVCGFMWAKVRFSAVAVIMLLVVIVLNLDQGQTR